MQTTPVKSPLQRTEAPPTALSYANDPVLSNQPQLCLCIRHCIFCWSLIGSFSERGGKGEDRCGDWARGGREKCVAKIVAFWQFEPKLKMMCVISVPLAQFPPICLELNKPLVMSQCCCVRLIGMFKQTKQWFTRQIQFYTLENWIQVFKTLKYYTHYFYVVIKPIESVSN